MGYKLFLKAKRWFIFENYNGTDLTTGLRSGLAAVIWKARGHPKTVIVTRFRLNKMFERKNVNIFPSV